MKKKGLSKHIRDWWIGLILPSFPDPVGSALQWLFGDMGTEVKADGFTYVKDNANKGTDRLQLQGVKNIFDGIDGKSVIGNVGNTQYSYVWIKQVVDNQILFSLANTTVTAVSIVAGVLTFGGSLTINNIYVDGVSKTPSEAGVILNDNAVHLLCIDYDQIATSNLVLGYDGTTYGNIELFDFRVGDAVEPIADVNLIYDNPNALFSTETGMWHLDENSGTTRFDSSGNDNHGTASGGVTWGTQDVVSFQNYYGYGLWSANDGVSGSQYLLDSLITTVGTYEIKYKTVLKNGATNVYQSGRNSTTDYVRISSQTQITMRSASVVYTFAVAAIPYDTAFELKITRDGSNVTRVFIDGVEATNSNVISSDFLTSALLNRSSTTVSDSIIKEIELVGVGKWSTISGWQDEIGSNNGNLGGTIEEAEIPALQSSIPPVNDVFGETLTYSGKAPKDGRLVESHCGTFDGVDNKIDFTEETLTTFDISARIKTSSATIQQIFSHSTDNNQLRVNADGNLRVITNATVDIDETTTGVDVADGSFHTVRFTNDGTTLKIYVDGTEKLSGTGSNNSFNLDQVGLRGGASDPFNGSICDVIIKDDIDGNILVHLPIAEGAGLVNYDISGNGNNGTIDATEGAFWANTQDFYHNNLLNGFSLYEHATSDPIKVPYQLSITPPSGYTLTEDRPSGRWHNGAETKWKPNPLNDPELIHRAVLDDTITRHNSDTFTRPEFMNKNDLAKSKDYVVYDKNITTEQGDLVDSVIGN